MWNRPVFVTLYNSYLYQKVIISIGFYNENIFLFELNINKDAPLHINVVNIDLWNNEKNALYLRSYKCS